MMSALHHQRLLLGGDDGDDDDDDGDDDGDGNDGDGDESLMMMMAMVVIMMMAMKGASCGTYLWSSASLASIIVPVQGFLQHDDD